MLVVARDHPLASRSSIGFAEVLDYDTVGLDRASAIQRFLAEKATRIGRAIRLRVQLRSFDAICRLVECNVGVGIVPETTVERTARTMAIKAVQLTDPWALRELTICVRDENALPPSGPGISGGQQQRRRGSAGQERRQHEAADLGGLPSVDRNRHTGGGQGRRQHHRSTIVQTAVERPCDTRRQSSCDGLGRERGDHPDGHRRDV